MIKALSICCAALMLALLNPAKATPVTFEFSGHVTQVPLDEIFGDITSGDAMKGSISFDTSVTDLVPTDPATGSYNFSAPFGMTITIGAHDFAAYGFLNIGILNSIVDQLTVLATSASDDLALELFLQDNNGTAFNTDQLPSALPPLFDFTQRDFHVDAVSDLGEAQVDGQLDGPASEIIPEPRVSALILAGGLVLLTQPAAKHKTFFQINQSFSNKPTKEHSTMSNSIWRKISWAAVFAIIPSTLLAVDGTILIDQNHALAGNVTPSDAPGFPVTISQPGSYRLSGNLTVPTADTTAIQITASNVTLDLNGFSIAGPVVCISLPTTCPAAGKGIACKRVAIPRRRVQEMSGP